MQRRVARIGGMMLVGWPVATPAQTVAPAPPPAPATIAGETAAGEQGVLVYPPSFFAGNNPNTALDMIVRLPGFTLDVGDVESRGLAETAGNVLIDGARPTSKSDTLDVILQRINANAVARVELIRGGATGVDMRGRSVVANVVLKPAPKTEIVLEPSAFFYTDGFVGKAVTASYTRRAGERQTEASVLVSGDRTTNDAQGSRVRSDASGGTLQRAALDLGNHYYTYDARGVVQRPLFGGKLRANAVLDYTLSRDTLATTIVTGSGDDEFTRERTATPNGELGFTWTGASGPRSTVEITGLQRLRRSDYHGMFASGGTELDFVDRATSGESVLRATDTFRPNAKLSLEGGGEVAYNFLDGRSSFSASGVAIPLPNATVFVDEVRGDGFVRATWQPSAKLTLEGELRVELSRIGETGDTSKTRSFVYPKPRILVTWQPRDGDQIRARIEQQVGQLDFGDFAASTEIALGTVVGGNADLRPQRTTLFEAVYERRFWKKGVVQFTLRHRELTDVVDVIPLVGGFDAVGNIGSGHGDFVGLDVTLPLDRLGLKNALFKADANLTRSSVTDPLTGERRRLSQQQAFQCAFSLNHDIKGGRFSYGFTHDCNVDRIRSYRGREVRTAVYEPFFGIYGQWKPSAKLSVRVDLANVTNGRSEGIRDIFTGPRNVAPFLYREDRTTRRGQNVYIQLRRVF